MHVFVDAVDSRRSRTAGCQRDARRFTRAKFLSVISLRSRSNLRSLFSVDHVASLLCISLIIKGLHLTAVS